MKWRDFLFVFFAGALLALGFAPMDVWPAAFISLGVFFILLTRAQTLKKSAFLGFFYGYGWAIAGTYWIANSLLVDAEKFGWLYPICVLGLSAVMALWFALFGAIYFKIRATDAALSNWLRFAVLWALIEYLRSVGMFGFPWNLLGSMALSMPPLAQLASIIGSYGVGLLLALLFTLPALIYLLPNQPTRVRIGGALLFWAAVGFALVQINLTPPLTEQSATRIRLVQANISQSMKWTQDGATQAEQLYNQLSQMPSQDGNASIPPVIIWPETAVPIPLRAKSTWPAQVGELAPKNGHIITGAMRIETPAPQQIRIYNSLLAINHSGALQAMYDKHQLVPFGEFVPLRSILPLEKITPGTLDFSRGEGATTIDIGEDVPPFSPLICYEVIFPWISIDAAHRPQWIVNITNDGWYGVSSGPYQHLAAARLRAIEQGLPLARAANTGVSALIDPYGRLVRALPLNTRGVIDATLPKPLPLTLYALYGEWPTWGLMLLLYIAALWIKRARPRSSPAPAHSDIHPSA